MDSALKKGQILTKKKEERAFQEVGEYEQGCGGGDVKIVFEVEGDKRWNQGRRGGDVMGGGVVLGDKRTGKTESWKNHKRI